MTENAAAASVSRRCQAVTPVAVLSAGSFGTALAIQLCAARVACRLVGRDVTAIRDAERTRRNPRYLTDCEFPATLVATADLDADAARRPRTSSSRHPAARGINWRR